VRGKVYNAHVTVGGDMAVSEGVNGNHMKEIRVGGFMKCRYIEGCNIKVGGGLFADYVIDSNVECMGDMTLAGPKSALIGGKTAVLGTLSANCIGNERGVRTRVALMESPSGGERAAELAAARDRARGVVKNSEESIAKVRKLMRQSGNDGLARLYRQLTEQLPAANEELMKIEEELKAIRADDSERFPGSIICRRVMYPGVDVFAGNMMMMRDQSNIEHCRLYLKNGEWARGLA
jgi:uncharacterized protein (DUF342 family)